MLHTLALLGLAFASPEARTAPSTPDGVGRIYSYIRSNRDGSEAERVHVYRAGRTRIEVAKMRERCTNAAFVTAELDLASGQATRLTGGRLLPDAAHQDFAELTYHAATHRLDAVVRTPQGEMRESVTIADEPWHLYDFDFASLTVTNQYRPDPRESFSFGLPLILVGGDKALSYLGRVDARFVREEEHEGRRALRFEATGPALGENGGPVWFDASEGHLLGASWGVPNHAEYKDFALRLTGISDGEAAWRRLLVEHFEGCPA